jgi:hypothetical protein
MLKPINLLTYYIFYKWFLHNRKNDIRHFQKKRQYKKEKFQIATPTRDYEKKI